MRVLLVEDDARLSASLAASLGDAGYAVDAVGDGEQAELFAEATPYDGIILDVMLPKARWRAGLPHPARAWPDHADPHADRARRHRGPRAGAG